MLNNFVEKKETFLDYYRKLFQSPQNLIFPRTVTHALGQKLQFLLIFGFGQNKNRNKI